LVGSTVKAVMTQPSRSSRKTRQPRGGAVRGLLGADCWCQHSSRISPANWSLSRAQLVPWGRWCQASRGGWPWVTRGTFSTAVAVSDSGRVVGTTTAAGSNLYHAFSSTERDGRVDLGPLGGDALAAAVNNRGQVVGDTFPDNIPHPSSWTQTGGIVDLGTLGGTH